jgi:hypothetical protein
MTKLHINGKHVQVTRSFTGHSVGDSIEWTATSDVSLSLDDAVAIQEREGYGTGGYGFESFKAVSLGGIFRVSWKCCANCD